MSFNWRRLFQPDKASKASLAVQPMETEALAQPREDELPQDSEMSFLDHLEDLRWTIIKGVGGVVLMTIFAAIFHNWVVDVILMGPARSDFITYRLLGLEFTDLHLQNRTVTGQFFALVGIVMAVGLVAGSPILIYYVWKFIEPGALPQRKGRHEIYRSLCDVLFCRGDSVWIPGDHPARTEFLQQLRHIGYHPK